MPQIVKINDIQVRKTIKYFTKVKLCVKEKWDTIDQFQRTSTTLESSFNIKEIGQNDIDKVNKDDPNGIE